VRLEPGVIFSIVPIKIVPVMVDVFNSWEATIVIRVVQIICALVALAKLKKLGHHLR
jgi:hypothetical protein